MQCWGVDPHLLWVAVSVTLAVSQAGHAVVFQSCVSLFGTTRYHRLSTSTFFFPPPHLVSFYTIIPLNRHHQSPLVGSPWIQMLIWCPASAIASDPVCAHFDYDVALTFLMVLSSDIRPKQRPLTIIIYGIRQVRSCKRKTQINIRLSLDMIVWAFPNRKRLKSLLMWIVVSTVHVAVVGFHAVLTDNCGQLSFNNSCHANLIGSLCFSCNGCCWSQSCICLIKMQVWPLAPLYGMKLSGNYTVKMKLHRQKVLRRGLTHNLNWPFFLDLLTIRNMHKKTPALYFKIEFSDNKLNRTLAKSPISCIPVWQDLMSSCS